MNEGRIDEYLSRVGMDQTMIEAMEYLKRLNDVTIGVLCDIAPPTNMSRIRNGVDMGQMIERILHGKEGIPIKVSGKEYILDLDGTLNYSDGDFFLSINGGSEIGRLAERIQEMASSRAEEHLRSRVESTPYLRRHDSEEIWSRNAVVAQQKQKQEWQ